MLEGLSRCSPRCPQPGGLTPPPHPSRTRELAGEGVGEPGWSRAQARQDRVPQKGADGLRGPGSRPQVGRMRPQVAEASRARMVSALGHTRRPQGQERDPVCCSPFRLCIPGSTELRGGAWGGALGTPLKGSRSQCLLSVPGGVPGPPWPRPQVRPAEQRCQRSSAVNASSALAITTVDLT